MPGKDMFRMLIAGCLVLISGKISFSEVKTNKSSFGLDEIVVTATKSEKTIRDVPGSVDVVTKDEIKKRNVKDIDEAVRMIPGVYDLKRKGFADIMPSINIRGLYGTNRNLILIDGQPVSDDVWRRFPLELIERIEVVKGPFSSLYGSNAMGGVVNVITGKPKEKLEVKINTGFETYNSQSYEMLSSGRADKWFYAASARKRQTDGYVSNLTVKTAASQTTKPASGTEVTGAEATTDKYGKKTFLIGDTGKNYYHDLAYNLKLGHEFSKDANLRIDYSRTDYKYGYEGGRSYLKDLSGNEVKTGTVYFYDHADANWKRLTGLTGADFESSYGGNIIDLINLSGAAKVSDVSLKGYLSYDKNDYWWVQPSLSAAYIQPSWNKKTSAELSAAKSLPRQQTLTIGAEFKKTEYELEQHNLSDWNDQNSRIGMTQNQKGKTTTSGFFLQDEIGLFEPLTVYLGGRYDKWQASDGYNFIIKSGTTKIDTFDDRDENNFSPRVSLVYKVGEDSRVKASIGQSFRGPTSSELYSGWEYTSSGVRRASLPNQDLKPEKVVSSELGFEKSFAGRVSCKTAYFYNRMSDYIYTKTFSGSELSAYNLQNYGDAAYYGNITQKQNIGKSKSQGLEFELRAKLSERFATFANCTAMATEVVENPANKASEGKKIPGIPETTANAGIDYDCAGWKAGIIGRYIGKRYSADDNSDTTTGVFGGYDPVSLVDAKVSYRREILGYVPTISFSCDNIFDKEYYQYYLSPKRTYGVNISLSRKFQ